jgi:hypothetical protein
VISLDGGWLAIEVWGCRWRRGRAQFSGLIQLQGLGERVLWKLLTSERLDCNIVRGFFQELVPVLIFVLQSRIEER